MKPGYYSLDYKFICYSGVWPDNSFTGIFITKARTKIWLYNGNEHRLGGPAIEFADGQTEYWVYRKYVKKEQHDLLYSIMKLKELL